MYPAQKTVAVGILMLYVIMQTFAIPGTIGLSLLSGALYGSSRGFALIAAVSTLGSTCCYAMSALFGRPLARAIWKQRLDDFSAEVAARSHDLLSYIIFLRVTPILPNVFINVASPIVGVPLREFFLGECVWLVDAGKQGGALRHEEDGRRGTLSAWTGIALLPARCLECVHSLNTRTHTVSTTCRCLVCACMPDPQLHRVVCQQRHCAGTLIGCAPNNFMAANAGDHLSDLDSLADLYNPRMLLLGLMVGAVALLPVYVKHRHKGSGVLASGAAVAEKKLR